jgi:hypothetical protein
VTVRRFQVGSTDAATSTGSTKSRSESKTCVRRAEIARQDHLRRIDRAALLDPEQQIGDQLRIERP